MQTSALHRAVLSILDLGLRFSDLFIAFAGDTTTHDISRASIVLKRHRSRRHRRQLQNVIGFVQPAPLSDEEDTDEDDEENEDEDYTRTVSFMASSMRPTDEGFFEQLDKISTELDGLVRFVRRGIENLAGRAGEGAYTFGVLAFALEDWDR